METYCERHQSNQFKRRSGVRDETICETVLAEANFHLQFLFSILLFAKDFIIYKFPLQRWLEHVGRLINYL